MNNNICDNIDVINQKIESSAIKSGRKREDILLLAVTKTIDVDRIKTAVDYGLTELGENKVQEIMDKYDIMDNNVKWHLIGHLQTNKVKYIIDKVSLIHSVDSVKLADEINKRAIQKELVADILIEVNISDEMSKYGVKSNDIYDMLEKVALLPNVKVRGLMTVAPFVEKGEENREYFRHMKDLFVDINEKKIDNIYMDILSMGMSGDYEVAIEEGATIVRIGTGIFGERLYI